MVDEVKEFVCPWCGTAIPLEYMPDSTRMAMVGKDDERLVCITCSDKFEIEIVSRMRDRMTEEKADAMGVSVAQLKALREEQEYWRKFDSEHVDDEIDVMDGRAAKKAFMDKRDPHEQAKPPLQIMRERFMKGMRKEMEKKIVVPGRSIQPKPRRGHA